MTGTTGALAGGAREHGNGAPAADAEEQGDIAGIAADSRIASLCTLISRATGFARVAAVAAVLGPTYFANLFQITNLLPILLHELLSGSLITAILVPALVKSLDQGDARAARALANGFLGTVLAVFLLAMLVCGLAAPLLIGLMTLPVDDPGIRARQLELGSLLVLVVLPQLLGYGLVAVGIAVQNAHRRFALAAAAPAIENLGTIVVLATFALIFGTGHDVDQVGTGEVLFLGLGCTLAVGLHAALQWWGALRLGVPLLPSAGWRAPEVRRILRLALPSSGYAGLNSATFFGLLVVAGSIPGGAVAFMIGINFFNLPVALCARPVAAAQLPRLSRSFHRGQLATFHATYRSSLGFGLFLALPASLLFVALGETLARAATFGEMSGPAAISLVATAVASLGAGIIGESIFLIANSASYARRDAVSPLLGMALRAATAAAGMAAALVFGSGAGVLLTLGLGYALATLVSAAFLHHRQRRVLPALAPGALRKALADFGLAVLALGPGLLVASWLADPDAGAGRSIALALGAIVSSGFGYLALQWLRGSSDLAALLVRAGTTTPLLGRPAASRS